MRTPMPAPARQEFVVIEGRNYFAPTGSDLRAALVLDTLPDRGRALLAAGQHVAHVRALYPHTYVTAAQALLDQLAMTVAAVETAEITLFERHVKSHWGRRPTLHRGLLEQTFGLADAPVSRVVTVEAVTAVVDLVDGVAMYKVLTCVVRVLALWLVDGETSVMRRHLSVMRELLAYWYAIVDFEVTKATDAS